MFRPLALLVPVFGTLVLATTSSPYLRGEVFWLRALLFPPPALHALYCADSFRAMEEGRVSREELWAQITRHHRVRFPSGVEFSSSMGLALEACLRLAKDSRDLLFGAVPSTFLFRLTPHFVVPARVGKPGEILAWRAQLVLRDRAGKDLVSLPFSDFTPLVRSKGNGFEGDVVYTFWKVSGDPVSGLYNHARDREALAAFLEAVPRAHGFAFVLERGGKREVYALTPERYPNLW